MSVHVFGIRHHGPGCARALASALQALAPDALLIEGPPDANEALAAVADAGLVPPVALLVHAADEPQLATFYPFAEFSPEWQALKYGIGRGLPTRFIDLPAMHGLALRRQAAKAAEAEASASADAGEADAPAEAPEASDDDEELRADPVGTLAEAAGFADHEQWWDLQIEQRRDAVGLFDAIGEAMAALREGHVERRLVERQREAYMRSCIRAAQKEGFERIAVVCGAWHAPALATLGPAKADAELTKGLPKLKVAATWIPWTYARLAARSGYGAGVDSPGWYGHLWRHGESAAVVWATRAARLLRGQDLDASAANVIETVRLGQALAAVRELPAPGLSELREAIESVLCGGQPERLALIRARLEIGDALGAVPAQAGQAPIWRDFEAEAKRVRLKLTTEQQLYELDLRKELDRDRSRLLHRLRVLGVEWGRPAASGRTSGTFKESWQLAWQPELAVELIAANLLGNTVELAAVQRLAERARAAGLAELSQLLETAIWAALPGAIDALLAELDARAATASDVGAQMLALGPLARLVRYGDVRETRVEHVRPVLHSLFERVVVGLLPACTQLDDDAAAQLVGAIGQAHAACLLVDDSGLRDDWLGALQALADAGAAHARLRGRACRLLLEQRRLGDGELARRASLALSVAEEPARAAQWIEGLVGGEGLVLAHQEELLATLDEWLAQLAPEVFQAQLPLLRRAFSGLSGPDRRAVAQRLKRSGPGASRRAPTAAAGDDFDAAKVAQLLPVLASILGARHV